MYLYFCGEDCPLLYDADGEEWYVWDLRGHPVGSSLARVKPFFQKQLEPCLRKCVSKAKAMHYFDKEAGPAESGDNVASAAASVAAAAASVVAEAGGCSAAAAASPHST